MYTRPTVGVCSTCQSNLETVDAHDNVSCQLYKCTNNEVDDWLRQKICALKTKPEFVLGPAQNKGTKGLKLGISSW